MFWHKLGQTAAERGEREGHGRSGMGEWGLSFVKRKPHWGLGHSDSEKLHRDLRRTLLLPAPRPPPPLTGKEQGRVERRPGHS